jgi:hypothetical protein
VTATHTRSHRRWIVALVAASMIGFGLGVFAHDQRLDEADLALQKAEGLLEAAQFGFPDAAKRERSFDKSIGRALQDIEEARAEFVKAALVADEP